jgi:hypothetical protein
MLVSGVALGIAAGLLAGHDWRRLITISIRLWPVLILVVGARAFGGLLPQIALGLYVAAMAGTVIVAIANWRLAGTALVAVGGALNLLVVSANGGMPVDAEAAARAGTDVPIDYLHVVASPTTYLPFLADMIPMAIFHSVYSVGDIAIAAGGFLIPFIVLARR